MQWPLRCRGLHLRRDEGIGHARDGDLHAHDPVALANSLRRRLRDRLDVRRARYRMQLRCSERREPREGNRECGKRGWRRGKRERVHHRHHVEGRERDHSRRDQHEPDCARAQPDHAEAIVRSPCDGELVNRSPAPTRPRRPPETPVLPLPAPTLAQVARTVKGPFGLSERWLGRQERDEIRAFQRCGRGRSRTCCGRRSP